MKNGVIFLVIMFTPRVMVIKISKMAHFTDVYMTTRQITPFFHLTFELYLLVNFIFSFPDHQNSVPWGPLFACSGL